MNKKIIVLIISSLMIISGIGLIFSNNNLKDKNNNVITDVSSPNIVNTTTSFNNISKIPINLKYFTLKDYNKNQFSSYIDASTAGGYGLPYENNILYVNDIPSGQTGFYFINESNDIVFQNFTTGNITLIHSITPLYYGATSITTQLSYLNAYQKSDGEVIGLYIYGWTSSGYSGIVNIEYYNLINNTFVNDNTNINAGTASIIDSLGYFAISPAIANTNYTNFYNIWTKEDYNLSTIDSSAIDTNEFNYIPGYNTIEEQHFTNGILYYNFTTFDTSTHSTKNYYLTYTANFTTSTGGSNNPVYLIYHTNYVIIVQTIYENSVNKGYITYVNLSTSPSLYKMIYWDSSVYQNYEDMGNQPIITNNGIIQAGNNAGSSVNSNAFFPFFSLLNLTIYDAINSTVQDTIDSNNVFEGYGTFGNSFDLNRSIELDFNDANSTYYMYYTSVFKYVAVPSNITVSKYNLQIKENGLPAGTSWTYTFNGTSYTLTNNSYNYSLINGNYALSVSSVNGYNVAYPSSITIDNTSKIALDMSF